VDQGVSWYRRRLDMAVTRALRLIPLSARAKLRTSRWLGVRSSGVLKKDKMVRPLRLRPERAERKVEAGIRACHLGSELVGRALFMLSNTFSNILRWAGPQVLYPMMHDQPSTNSVQWENR
jgi:hypothetical protein